MAFLRRYPLLLPALGIGLGIVCKETVSVAWAAAVLIFSALLSSLTLKKRSFWIFLFLGFAALGSLLIQRQIILDGRNQITYLREGTVSLRGVVRDEPQVIRKGRLVKFKFPLEVRFGAEKEKVWVCLINARGEIHRGDELLLFGGLKPVKYKKIGRPRYRFLGIGKRSYYLLGEKKLTPAPFKRLNRFLSDRFQDLLPLNEAAFLRAVVLGDRSGISRKTKNKFSRLGIIHILSVSGFHMAAVGFFLYLIGRLFLLGPRTCITIALTGLLFYFLISGGRPPTFRALLMAAALFSGKLMGRQGNGLNGLSAAFLIALMVRPSELFNMSFQLSYLVVLGIILTFMFLQSISAEQKPDFWKRLRKKLIDLMKISAAAYLFSFGLISFYFGGVSIFTIFLNFVLSPIFAGIIALGFLLCFGACWGDLVGGFFSLLVYAPSLVLLETVQNLSEISVFKERGIRFSLFQTVMYYFGLFTVYFMYAVRSKMRIWTLKKLGNFRRPGHG